MKAKPAPAPEQQDALQRYANKYGRNWKSLLAEAWQTGAELKEGRDGALLRQVRNELGPKWLRSRANQVRPQ